MNCVSNNYMELVENPYNKGIISGLTYKKITVKIKLWGCFRSKCSFHFIYVNRARP